MSDSNIDKYDVLLEMLGHGNKKIALSKSEMNEHFKVVCDLANELGISTNDMECDLVLWNDDVNDMIHVVLALYEVCGLGNDDSTRVMHEAHNEGKTIAKSGRMEDLMHLALGLKERGIIASIQFRNPD